MPATDISAAEMTTSAKVKAVIDATPAVIKSGDVDRIITHRDGILVLRALMGKGGTVELTPRRKVDGKGNPVSDKEGKPVFVTSKVKVSETGLTQVFDDCLTAMIENGMIDRDAVPTIITRDKAGRKAADISSVSDSILL